MLFPHGHLLSARWRPLRWLAVAATTVQLLTSALSGVNYGANVPFAQHPLRLLDADLARIAYSTAQQLTLIALLGAMVSLVVRLRRARGQERQQLKWLVYTTVVGAMAFAVVAMLTWEPVTVAVFWFPAVAVAIGVAIFKYRLYEIDRLDPGMAVAATTGRSLHGCSPLTPTSLLREGPCGCRAAGGALCGDA